MNRVQLDEELQALMRKVVDGIAEMEVVREEVEEYGRQPIEPSNSKPEMPPVPTLSDLEEDDVYAFKSFRDWK